jgi:hypothetical protein
MVEQMITIKFRDKLARLAFFELYLDHSERAVFGVVPRPRTDNFSHTIVQCREDHQFAFFVAVFGLVRGALGQCLLYERFLLLAMMQNQHLSQFFRRAGQLLLD